MKCPSCDRDAPLLVGYEHLSGSIEECCQNCADTYEFFEGCLMYLVRARRAEDKAFDFKAQEWT